MELFEFLNILIERPGEWAEIAPGEKRKQYFMTQRRMAINYPMQANALQHLKINQSEVVDFWHRYVRKFYTRTPKWMYTAGLAKSKKEKEKKLDVSEKLIAQYAKDKSIDIKSVKDALVLFEKEMVAELKQFEKTIPRK